MCFDESEAFNLLPFSIPFIKQPIEKMAKKALKLLIYQIEKKGEENSKFNDALKIIEKELINPRTEDELFNSLMIVFKAINKNL